MEHIRVCFLFLNVYYWEVTLSVVALANRPTGRQAGTNRHL